MTYQLPQLLPHCNYSHFCASCRDLEGGRSFRRGVIDRQGLQAVHEDFDCPKDLQWGSAQPKPSPAGIELAMKKADTCRACPVSLKVVTRKEHPSQYSTKCGSKLCSRCGNVSLINGKCPEGKFTHHGMV